MVIPETRHDLERTWWWLFQKRVMRIKFDIFVRFYYYNAAYTDTCESLHFIHICKIFVWPHHFH